MSVPDPRTSAAVDLIILLTVFALGFLMVPSLNLFAGQYHGLLVVFAAAAMQFLVEGAAPLAVMAVRNEQFASYGFTRRKLVIALGMAVGTALLYDFAYSCMTREFLWIPFGRHGVLRMAASSGFFSAALGVPLVLLVWGFIEAFFGIYFAKKVNLALGHDGSGWNAPGVLAFAVFNGAIHWMLGQGVGGFVSSLATGYAVTAIPAMTENAWGGILVQVLTNAIG